MPPTAAGSPGSTFDHPVGTATTGLSVEWRSVGQPRPGSVRRADLAADAAFSDATFNDTGSHATATPDGKRY